VSHSAEGRFAIQSGQWKLLLWPGSGGWSSPTPNPSVWLKTHATDLATLPPFQLYDLSSDPAEKNNLAAAHPEIVRRLGLELRATIERSPNAPADWPQLAWRRQFVP
jgi:hypothetical protein